MVDNRDMSIAPDRHPLRGVAARIGAGLAVLGGVASSLATVGAITADQAGASQGVLAALAGLLAAISAAAAAFGTARRGERVVTPVADPRADDGTKLVPLSGPGRSAPL